MKKIFIILTVVVLFILHFTARPQSFDSLQNIRIIVTFTAPPSLYTVTKAPLRFNKLFAFSMKEDDGDKDIYTHAFQLLNGGVISGVTYPGLKFTDGCGNDIKFKMTESLYSFANSSGGLIDIHDPSSTYANVNVTWPQMIEMFQQNWSIANHGLAVGAIGSTEYDIARNHSYVKLKLQPATSGGPDMRVFVNPSGSLAYSAPAWAQNYLVCYREGYTWANPSFDVSGPFPHSNIAMHHTNTYEAVNLSNFVTNLANTSTGGTHQWGVVFTHAVNNGGYGYSFNSFKTHMQFIASTYGKGALDNIWMATEEEVLEYLLVRDSISPVTQLAGNVLTISFTGSLSNAYRFYNSTLLISANQTISSIAVQGVTASSYNGAGSGNGLVNITWNGHYIVPAEVNAERWVSKTEASHSQEDANVAMDYIQMVPPGPVQRAFRVRLCQVPGLTLPSDFCTYRNAPIASIPALGGCPGRTLVVPVLVDSFLTITSFVQRIEYDPAVMTFVSGVAGKPAVLSGMTITDAAVGSPSTFRKISISWSSATAKSLLVHDTLARLTFNFLTGNTTVGFNTSSNNGADCGYVDEGGHPMYQYPLTGYFINGSVSNARLAAPGSITGPVSICNSTTGNVYSVSPVTGATSYSWTMPTGFTVTQGANTNSITTSAGVTSASGSFTVRAVNVCTDNPLSPALAVTVKVRPVPTLSGPASCCVGEPLISYATEASMSDYSWTISPGGVITSGGSSNTVNADWILQGSQSISVSYKAANGCTALVPTVKNVLVSPRPVPVITGPDTICSSSLATYSTATGMPSYAWTISPGGSIISGGTTSAVNVKWNTQGAHWIRVNYSTPAGCSALTPTEKQVYVKLTAQPVISGPDSLCEGTGPVTYSTQGGMAGYVWEIPSGGTILSGTGTNTILVQWGSHGLYQVRLNYTIPGGCAAAVPAILPVNIHERPVPLILGTDSVCKGTTGSLYRTQAGMSQYQWTVSSEGAIISGQGNDSLYVSWNNPGNGSVSLQYVNPFGCASSVPTVFNVRVNPLPLPTIAGTGSACQNSGGLLYVTQAGKTAYTWNTGGGGNIVSGQGNDSVMVNWTSTGVQQLYVNYYDSNHCTAASPASFPVLVSSRPQPTISGQAVICSGTSAVYTTQPSMGNYSWNVPSGGVITSGQGSSGVTVLWTLSGPRTVTVNYTNASGCAAVSPASFNVTVNPSPAPVISGPSSACLNTTQVFTAQSGMSNYSWSVSSGGVIVSGGGSPSVQVSWTVSGDQTLSLVCMNSYGCQNPAPVVRNIRVHALPSPSISGQPSACHLSAGNIYATQHGKSAYVWSVTSGGVITGGAGSDSVQVSWPGTGLQVLHVNYLDSNGCTSPQPASFSVNVHALPVPMISGPSPVCQGGTGGNPYTTQTGMQNYLWNISSGGTILSGLGTENIQVIWDSAGARSVSVNYSNSFGCFALNPVVKAVTVNPLPVPTIAGPDSICMNQTGIYTTEPGMNSYQWEILPGGYSVSGLNTSTIHVTWTTAGAKTIKVNYLNGNSCTAAIPTVFNVYVFPLPLPVISGGNTACANSAGNLYTTDAGMSAYVWTVSALGTITGGQGSDSVYISWGNQGTGTVGVTYVSPDGCSPSSQSVKSVTVNPRPVPVISGPNPVCVNAGPKTYSTQSGQQNYDWFVSAGDSITGGLGTASVQVQWAGAGSHWIAVNYVSPAGCQALVPDTMIVTVNPLPGNAGAISGPTSLCTPASWQEYSVPPIANAGGYYWTLPPGGVFQGSSNTNVIHVTWLPTAQSGDITVYGTSACGNGQASSLFVELHPVPATPYITLAPDNVLHSSAPFGNQWHFNNQVLPGDTLDHLQAVLTGDYFTVVTLGGCSSDTSNLKHVIAVGVEKNLPFMVNIYPNPVSGILHIELESPGFSLLSLSLLNELGAEIYSAGQQIPPGHSEFMIDLEKYSPGAMILLVRSGDSVIRRKIIKN